MGGFSIRLSRIVWICIGTSACCERQTNWVQAKLPLKTGDELRAPQKSSHRVCDFCSGLCKSSRLLPRYRVRAGGLKNTRKVLISAKMYQRGQVLAKVNHNSRAALHITVE
jgi:hypothetical protein